MKDERPTSIRLSASTRAIIREIQRQNPDLEGNRSAAITRALYDWQDRHAPDLRAPQQEGTMNKRTRFFECPHCGQVVQGWNASQDVDCCDKQLGSSWVEIPGPNAPTEIDTIQAMAVVANACVKAAGGDLGDCLNWLEDGDFDIADPAQEYVDEWREVIISASGSSFHWNEGAGTFCLYGETEDGLAWETDDMPAESYEDGLHEAIDYLRAQQT